MTKKIDQEKNSTEEKNSTDVKLNQWVTKLSPITRGLQVTDSLLPFEARASKTLLDTLSNRWGEMDTSDNQSPEETFNFLMDFYDIVRDSQSIFFPKEQVRRLLRFIDKFKIVSAKFVVDKGSIENLETKKSARTALRKLFSAGIIEKYSASMLIAKINKPLANLKRTELYGIPGLDESGYRDIVEFYSLKTSNAYEDEHFKRKTLKNKKELIEMEEESPITVYQLEESIKNLERSIEILKRPNSRVRSRAQVINEKEDRVRRLKERLEERKNER